MQGFSPDQITNVLQPIFEQSFREINTTAAASGQTMAESLAEPFRGEVKRAVSELSASLTALNSVNVNGPAEALRQGEDAYKRLNSYAANYAQLVEEGRISEEYAKLAMEGKAAMILEQVAAYSAARAGALGLGEAVGWVKGQLSEATAQTWALAGAISQQLANANAVQGRFEVMAATAKRTAGIEGRIWLDKVLPGTPDITTKGEITGKSLVMGVARGITGGGGGGGSPIQDAFNSILGKVKGVLSSALSGDIGGLDPKDFLPREDAINENARRLAAIMRDGLGNQDWLPEFKAETGGLFDELIAAGDVRGAAARILQEFQAGMRPELLDRDQVKENVRRMILGEQSMAELADQIARELAAETGTSLARVQSMVGAQLGTTPGAGMQQATGEGADGGVQAESFVSGWVATMNKLYTRIYETGAESGTQWGAGFMATVESGIPGALIGILVALVTPGVMAQMAQQQSAAAAR